MHSLSPSILLCTFEKSLEKNALLKEFCIVMITDISLKPYDLCFLQSSQQQLFLRHYSTWTWCCQKLRAYVSLEHHVDFSFRIPFVDDLRTWRSLWWWLGVCQGCRYYLNFLQQENVPRHVQTSGVQSINRADTRKFWKSFKPADLVRRSFQTHASLCEHHQLNCKRE